MNAKRGFAPIVLLIILAVVVIGGGAYYFSQKKAETPQTSTTSDTTQVDTQTTPAQPASVVKTYTDTAYGFSFQYPTSQSSTFKIVDTKVDTSFGPRLKSYSFTYNQNSDVSVSVYSKDTFHANSKVGSFVLKNGCWIDDYSKEVFSPTQKNFGSNPATEVGGSQMSDPAHYEYAVVTSSNYILLVTATYKNSLQDPSLDNTIKSITFQKGITPVSIHCSPDAKPTAPKVGPFSVKVISGRDVQFSGYADVSIAGTIGVDFGDGTDIAIMGLATDCKGNCSSNLSRIHTYANAGTYTVKFVKIDGSTHQVVQTYDTKTIPVL